VRQLDLDERHRSIECDDREMSGERFNADVLIRVSRWSGNALDHGRAGLHVERDITSLVDRSHIVGNRTGGWNGKLPRFRERGSRQSHR